MTEFVTPEALMGDPLLPHVLDILSDPASDGLLLAGGFGIRVKQTALADQIRDSRTLISPVPIARATQDIDIFLRLDLLVQKDKGIAVRDLLNRLGYAVIEGSESWQFGKLRDPVTGRYQVKIDLLAREPRQEEPVRFDSRRVGRRAKIGIHGRTTPEAFAVHDSPTGVRVTGRRSDDNEIQTTIFVPHPYAAVNMKVRAAYDWLRATNEGKEPRPFSEKHAFDVYLLVAMLLRSELAECRDLAAKYRDEPAAREVKLEAASLFAEADGLASREVRRQLQGLPSDHSTFYEALTELLGAK